MTDGVRSSRPGGVPGPGALEDYLEALIADDAPAPPSGPEQAAAARLRRDLVPIHPSFRFEERLARRLQEVAAGRRRVAAGAEGLVVPFARQGRTSGAAIQAARQANDDAALLDAIASGAVDPGAPQRAAVAAPVLIGGALTSAALSLAGVAWVAWRASRSSRRGSPMRRAARAAHARTGSNRADRQLAPWSRARGSR